jgi:REP element-mobilizing transposase RayT
VDRDHNQYGAPLAPRDPDREEDARNRMSDDPVKLTMEQRRIVERAILDLCQRFNWPVHAIAPQSDHVHVVVTAARDGDALREAIKASASRELNKHFGKHKWWAENGSCKYLWERAYFFSAVDYVTRQRDF